MTLKTVGNTMEVWSWQKKEASIFFNWTVFWLMSSLFLGACTQVPQPALPEVMSTAPQIRKEAPAPTRASINVENLLPIKELVPQMAMDNTLPFDDKLFSFSARSTPLRDVLMGLAKQADLNIALSKEVDGEAAVSVEFHNLPLRQAMEEILRTFEYSYDISGNILRIKAIETRILKFDYPLIYSKATSDVGGDMLGSSGGTSSGSSDSDISAEFSVKTQVEDEDSLNIWKQIKDMLQPKEEDQGSQNQGETAGLLSTIGRATVDSASGTIVVTDRPDVLDMVEKVLEQMQSTLKRQVIIEAKIMEVVLNHGHQYGVDWSAIQTGAHSAYTLASNMATNLAAGTGTFQLNLGKSAGEDGLSALIDAIRTQGDVNTISSPRINVINNQSATISIGRTIPYLDFEIENITAGDTVSYKAVPTIQRAQAGVSLGITPQISGDGVITLHIIPVITNQVGSETFTYDNESWPVPILDTRSASTIISALDNETIVLGGLIQDSSSDDRTSVPILGSIPVIGQFLFGNQTKKSRKIELVILLTPRIVQR
ncbi:hypothetical protein [Desulfobacula sp.]|uniref:hypothetical protein n=1 Tax=Desulfobacula sp. TaxID=2593537 RepID=UPI0026115779|nr:hypothetical protein [Desulfobacula sp.]